VDIVGALLATGAVIVVVDLVIRVVAIVVIPRDRLPTAAMAWLLAVFFIPVIGVLLFLLIGNPKLPEQRRLKQREMDEVIATESAGMAPPSDAEGWPIGLDPVVTLAESLTRMPLVGGNAAELIPDYQDSLDAMAAAVGTARTYVHVEFYILSQDETTRPFFDALEAAVGRGVTVRVLLDHWASSHCPDYKSTLERLTAMGAHWRLMLPVQPMKGKYQRLDLRNHRKLLVVDGRLAFVGSQNVIDRSYNKPKNLKRGLKWQELMCRLEGPVVESVDSVFATDWFIETDERLPFRATPAPERRGDLDCQVIPSGPGYPVENNLQVFLSLLYAARERVIITSPYFVPDDSMLRGLMAATARGVHVELFVSEVGDQGLVWHAQRSYYAALFRAGVKVFCYPAPFILHAKHFSIDEDVALIGSSNMDMRSFGLNSEISMMVHSREFVAQMRAVEHSYRSVSNELTPEMWSNEPLRATTLDGLARLTSALQ
jgi:cardiolipin synthase A/B